MKTRWLCGVTLCAMSLVSAYGRNGVRPGASPSANAQAAAKPPNAFEQGLLEAQQTMLQAMAKQDRNYIIQTLADDFLAIDPSGNTYDKGGVLENLDAAGGGEPKQGPPILYDFKVLQLNDNAGLVAFNLVLPGSRPRYQHISTTWVKQDGQWKLKFEQSTPNMWSASDFD